MTVTATIERQRGQTAEPPARSPRARIVWTLAGLLLVVVIVPAVALSMVGSTAYQRLPSRHRVFTTPITAVTVDASSGDITIERGSDETTRVTTTGVHGLTLPTDEEHVVGHSLIIRSSCGTQIFNDRCNRNYVVQLPSDAAVTASSGQGNVTVSGMARAISAHSDQGDVTISGGSGKLRASSGQGAVTIARSSASSVSVQSGQGDVSVDLTLPPSRVSASSGQGGVTVLLPKGRDSYQVHATSGQGNISNSVDQSPTSPRVVTASSGQGDVTVGYREGAGSG
jgi:hypothetical protein